LIKGKKIIVLFDSNDLHLMTAKQYIKLDLLALIDLEIARKDVE